MQGPYTEQEWQQWITEEGTELEIISPDELRREMLAMLEENLEK